jgi:hypothetical protein
MLSLAKADMAVIITFAEVGFGTLRIAVERKGWNPEGFFEESSVLVKGK